MQTSECRLQTAECRLQSAESAEYDAPSPHSALCTKNSTLLHTHIVATRSELSLHRAAVTEVVAHSVEDQVATQWSEDGPSEDVLFGERSGSYSTTMGRITLVTLATDQALDTVQEAVRVAEIARSSYCPCNKSKPDYT